MALFMQQRPLPEQRPRNPVLHSGRSIDSGLFFGNQRDPSHCTDRHRHQRGNEREFSGSSDRHRVAP